MTEEARASSEPTRVDVIQTELAAALERIDDALRGDAKANSGAYRGVSDRLLPKLTNAVAIDAQRPFGTPVRSARSEPWKPATSPRPASLEERRRIEHRRMPWSAGYEQWLADGKNRRLQATNDETASSPHLGSMGRLATHAALPLEEGGSDAYR